MIGAIAGDVVGSVYEGSGFKSKKFPLMGPSATVTDDTVLALAVAQCLMDGGDFAVYLRQFARRYPNAGYGPMFIDWFRSDLAGPYQSFGNGSAMRVAAIAYASDELDTVLRLAKESAEPTHNHIEGVKGAQSTAAAIWWALNGHPRDEIRSLITNHFGYDLSSTVDSIRPYYQMDATCQGSVPQAFICVLEAKDFEDALRNAVSIGGDSDTIACIAGAIGEAIWGVPPRIARDAIKHLDPYLKSVLMTFDARYLRNRQTKEPRDLAAVDAVLRPPWIAKPEWPSDSMGWRMGGEIYYHQFRDEFLSLTVADKIAYERRYPAPDDWRALYDSLRSDREQGLGVVEQIKG